MNCPDWCDLASRRDEAPELWERALLHHDTCDRCRRDALAAEPTLLFRQMAAPELGRADIAAIKQAVTTMRRTLPLAEAAEDSAAEGVGGRSRRAQRSKKVWLQAAVLAVILFGAALFQGGLEHEKNALDPASSAPPAALVATTQAHGDPVALPPWNDLSLEELPLVEDADPSYGSIVEVVGQDISFVLVVPTLDV